MTGAPTLIRHLRIHGVVQGVGFRQTLRSEAQSLGVAGWVRNRQDGTVEALLQGQPEQVQALVQWARHGPPGARVSRVDITDAAGESNGAVNDEVNNAGAGNDFLCHPTL